MKRNREPQLEYHSKSSEQVIKKIKASIREELMDCAHKVQQLSDEELLEAITEAAVLPMMEANLNLADRRDVIQSLFSSLRGFDVLQSLMDDPEITEIMVNRHDEIFIEKAGKLYPTEIRFDSPTHYQQFLSHYFAAANRQLSISRPIADLRLNDGSRAHAVIEPISLSAPALNIRKFTGLRPSADELVRLGSISRAALEYLKTKVIEREAIFISGGTGSGKTTLLNILSSFIPSDERVITIEDSAELQLQDLPNLVRLEARRSSNDRQRCSIRDLIRASLRMRPDRIIVGEIRAEESCDLLDAMNTGHPGSLSTGHANSGLDMLNRLSNLIQAYSRLPYENIQRNLAAGIRVLVHVERDRFGHRHVCEISELKGYADKSFQIQNIFLRKEGELKHVRS
ncbi:MAG: ATPase, T2SS/T4P/T4SS family [Eubacteriales bacterium]|nr:ATPase, T2SS/T4P/T4SS family [Eubacteriales bacterium]